MLIPRTPGGLAVYSFPTENGVMLDVPEGNFIVLTPDGKFGKMDMQTFMANFEEKDANTAGLTFDEKRLFEKMNKLFGKNIEKILGKLAEEYNELFEAFERYLSREKTQREINEINPGTHDITDVDNACIDSDYLLEVIQLVINRTDETEESKTAMLEYIKKLPQIEHIEV